MTQSRFSLPGKVALVTGGRRGIGKAIALVLAEAGASVAVCDAVVEGGELAGTVEGVRNLGRRSLGVQADVTRKADVESAVRRVTAELGPIDILVNNAGIRQTNPLLDTPEDEWDQVIETNLKSLYLCCQAVARGMVERKKGNIINIASMLGLNPLGGRNIVYSISKAGVVMLTRVLARDLGPFNIRVNAICPGMTTTEMTRPLWTNEEGLKTYNQTVPLGRMGEPADIAHAALYLASDAASYVTGAALVVDGGRIA